MIPELKADVQVVTKQRPSKTWKLDLKSGRIRGFIDEDEAVGQSAFMAVQCERYKHLIFSHQYGSELHTLVGKSPDFVFSEAKRMITEALEIDTRITDIRDFTFKDGVIRWTIDTIYGSKDVEWEVPDDS